MRDAPLGWGAGGTCGTYVQTYWKKGRRKSKSREGRKTLFYNILLKLTGQSKVFWILQ